METIRKYKIFVFGVVGFVALFVIYTLFFKGGDTPSPGELQTTSSATSEIEAVTVDLLALLLSLKTLDIDTTIFSDDRFKSLTDFSVALIPQPVGRLNPFLPFGGAVKSAESIPIVGRPSGSPRSSFPGAAR